MPLESWEWFSHLEGRGNLTRAADELHITQQTLSARLGSLEKELDAQLVVRSSPLSLTPAGKEFAAYALDYERTKAEMLRKVGDASGDCSGLLRIGVSHTRSQILMPHVVREFSKGHPHVRIDIEEGTNDELLGMVERREVDMAIARFGQNHPGVRVSPLFHEEVVLAIEPGLLESVMEMPAPQAVAQLELSGLSGLRDCPFLLCNEDDVSGRIARSELRRAGVKAEVASAAENILTLITMCKYGVGAVFSPSNVLDSVGYLSDGLVRVRLSPEARYEISLGIPVDAHAWTPAELLEDTIGALYGEA